MRRFVLREALLNRRELEHLVQDVNATLEVLELLEQRNHVERRHVLGMREREVRELVDIGHMARALRERDDVAMRHLLPVALLNRPDGTERVEHLARHGRELTVNAVFADIGQRALVHDRVLTELHLDHMEAEGFDLPDERLHRAIRRARGARRGKRALYDAQVGQKLVGGVVHGVGVAAHGRVQAVRHDEHDGAMRLEGRNRARPRREHLAHLDLMVPEIQ